MTELDITKLVCYGCAHSAAYAEYPSHPSGERPCCFCVRNKDRQDPPAVATWYDGTIPVMVPMDCYHSMDMLNQTANRGK